MVSLDHPAVRAVPNPPPLSSSSPSPAPYASSAHARHARQPPIIIVRIISLMKMAASQGAVGPAAALQSQHYLNVAHWSPGVIQQQQQQHPLHTARSLERALEDAVCSGMLNISGRKLREYPGHNYDLTDTTQAGGSRRCGLISLRAPLTRFSRFMF